MAVIYEVHSLSSQAEGERKNTDGLERPKGLCLFVVSICPIFLLLTEKSISGVLFFSLVCLLSNNKVYPSKNT